VFNPLLVNIYRAHLEKKSEKQGKKFHFNSELKIFTEERLKSKHGRQQPW
jgi:hypothetical protein